MLAKTSLSDASETPYGKVNTPGLGSNGHEEELRFSGDRFLGLGEN